jgi:hypothetical protein
MVFGEHVGTSESFPHLHTLFESRGAVACFGITEVIAYHQPLEKRILS